MRQFKSDDAKWKIEVWFDDAPVRGNVIASGNDDIDKQAEEHVLEEINRGNVWAWATVTITVTWAGFSSFDCLGCVSEKSEESFKHTDGYFRNMCQQALSNVFDDIKKSGWEFNAIDQEVELAIKKAIDTPVNATEMGYLDQIVRC